MSFSFLDIRWVTVMAQFSLDMAVRPNIKVIDLCCGGSWCQLTAQRGRMKDLLRCSS